MTHTLQRLVPELVAIARSAGAAAMRFYTGDMAVRRKRDASPVTEADDAAEAIILDGLRKLTPDIPAISEEAVARGETATDATSPPRWFWLVDPIDGTKEFVARNGEFTVNIGLVHDQRPVLGILHAPVSDTTYAACGPGTATVRRGDAAPQPIRARKPPPDGVVVVASRSHGSKAATAAYLEQFRVAEKRLLGSALKFGLIAEGAADLYPRLGPTMEWDTCAGQAILEGAHGHVTTLNGGPLLYGKPRFENPDFVARGDEP
ncbi:MAG TPA: 3'(2'),5'-bisphosphate nucleotidase CysQ [Alphaproteobacteria bacterium]